MVRTWVELTDEQLQTLRKLAANERVSVSEIVRRSVERYLKSRSGPDWEERRRRAEEVIGTFTADATDISEEHDKYLAEAYADTKP